jgi:hypothetical protein
MVNFLVPKKGMRRRTEFCKYRNKLKSFSKCSDIIIYEFKFYSYTCIWNRIAEVLSAGLYSHNIGTIIFSSWIFQFGILT